jgi:hypothetical protein
MESVNIIKKLKGAFMKKLIIFIVLLTVLFLSCDNIGLAGNFFVTKTMQSQIPGDPWSDFKVEYKNASTTQLNVVKLYYLDGTSKEFYVRCPETSETLPVNGKKVVHYEAYNK